MRLPKLYLFSQIRGIKRMSTISSLNYLRGPTLSFTTQRAGLLPRDFVYPWRFFYLMKLAAVSLVFFMLVQHVLSAPTQPPPIIAPQPRHPDTGHRINSILQQVEHVHGCNARGCEHVEISQAGLHFEQHLASTHFSTSSGQSKILTISVLLSDDLEFL